MAASFLAQTNDSAAREFMARGIADEYGFAIVSIKHSEVRVEMVVALRRQATQEIVYVEEPCPKDFPSETWKQRVMALA